MASKTQSGRLRHRIVIEAPVAEPDRNTLGEPKPSWSVFCRVWAEVQMGAGREFIAAQRVEPELTHVIILRWREGITAEMRVCWAGSFLQISGPPTIDEQGWWMQLRCIDSPNRSW